MAPRRLLGQILKESGAIHEGMVQEALSVHKAEMTRLLQLGALIPLHIARAVGPAPKAGRPRWICLLYTSPSPRD